MPRDSRDFANVDFGVEVGGKSLAMVAAIAIQNVERIDAIEIMLFQIGREHAGDAGVKTRTQQSCKARILVTILIRPLPMIFELCDIQRLVICRVHIMHASGQAGVHDV